MSETRWRRALITGASSGIGAAFARRLAPACDALTLVARRTERLADLAGELQAHCEVSLLPCDLTGAVGVAEVVEHLRQHGPVELLINNAGFSTLGAFRDSDPDAEIAMLRLHQEAVLLLTRAALPAMCDAGRGAIVNVSSVAAWMTLPGVATYAGSKAFLVAFTRALHAEVAASGVQVQCLCPGYTRTEIHSRDSFAGFATDRIPEQLWMEADAVVDESLAALRGDAWLVVPGAHNRALLRDALAGTLDALGE